MVLLASGLCEEAYIILRKTRNFEIARNEIRIDINADKTKYMIMSRDQNAELSHNIKIGRISFEREVEFKYL
jgi:hypothetical protein